MRAKRMILSLLLAVCLIAGLLPATALAAGTGKALQKGAACISGYNGSYNYIYYGTWDGSPMKWRVLSTSGNGGTYDKSPSNGVLFLLSEKLLGTAGSSMGSVYFNKNNQFFWQGSDAQGWCKDFAGESGEAVADAFTAAELDAILKTTKSDEEYTGTSATTSITFSASENILNGDRVFFLSAEEAEKAAYGLDTNGKRVAQWEGADSWWWLRSYSSPFYVGQVAKRGYLSRSEASVDYAARPAFNLNPDEVLLTSAAVGGKPEGFNEVFAYNGKEWKLTLIDNSRTGFAAEVKDIDGKTYVSYSGATTGANEYVSALIAKSDLNTISYYGRLKNVAATSDASGEVEIDLTGKMNEGDTLYIFNEQYNGDYKTDYSSPLREVTIPSESQTYTISFDANGGTGTMDGEEVQEGEYTLPANGFTAPEGKHFKAWAAGSTDGTLYDAGTSYTVTANTTFYAIWEDEAVCSISADPDLLNFDSVAMDASGSYTLPEPKTVTITNTGNQRLTLEPPTPTYYTISSYSQNILEPNEKATFTIQPKNDLVGQYFEPISVKATNDNGSTRVSADIRAAFEIVPYDGKWHINVSATPSDAGSVSGDGDYWTRDSATVTATPNSGYKFVEWTENGAQVSTDASYQFTVFRSRDLVAVFEEDGTTHTHSYTLEEPIPAALKSAATCTEAAVYYKSCECGDISDTETFTYGSPLEHDWSTTWSMDSTSHWHACKRHSCLAEADMEAHIPGPEATAENPQICTVCDYEITPALEHTHTWGAWISNGNGTHTRTCEGNSSHTETFNCSGGTATCVSPAVCDTCNTAYGEKDANNHTGGTEIRDKAEPTTDSEGYTGDTWCLGCNTMIEKGKTIPKKGGSSGGGGTTPTPPAPGSTDNSTPADSSTVSGGNDGNTSSEPAAAPVTTPVSGGSTTAPAKNPETGNAAPTYENYTVQKGDTLGAIAKKYGCTVDEILAANSDLIKNPNRIYPGWQLKIPQRGAAATANVSNVSASVDKTTGVYIVKQGDTLWAIAKKCGCTISEIISLNEERIANPNRIFPGWELKIPQN